MKIFNIAILDDNKSKINTIEVLFMQQNDKSTNLYDERYANYQLKLIPIDVEKSYDEIINEIIQNKFDAIIIDYDFSSFAKTTNNGVFAAKKIQEKFSEFPLFILTAYEERLFKNEVFDAYQIYNYDNYINNEAVAKEFHSHIIEQILKSKKQIELWEKELIELSESTEKDIDVKISSRIIELNDKLEKALDGEYSLPTKIKEDLYSNKLDKLLKQADKLLEEK